MLNPINNYLKKRFNYDPQIDIDEDLKAKKELSDFEYFVGYCKNKNFSKTMIENLDYKFLIPSIEYDGELFSPLKYLFYWGYISDIKYLSEDGTVLLKSFKEDVKDLLLNLSSEQIDELSQYRNVGLDIIEILYLNMYNYAYLDFVFDIEYGCGCYSDNEFKSMKLKDSNYSFPELDMMKKIQKQFKLSSDDIVNLLEEEIYDFATDYVGDNNLNKKEEFIEYWQNYLKLAILKNKLIFLV